MHAPIATLSFFLFTISGRTGVTAPCSVRGIKPRTTGAARVAAAAECSCVVGPRGDRRGWNVTPQATRDNSSASDTEWLELLAGKLVSQTSEGEQL